MSFTGKERAAFRSEAHHLDPVVHIGQQGITPAVMQSIKDALRTKELIKIQVARTSDTTVKEAAPRLSQQLGAEVIQVIGRTLTLYKHNPEIVRREGDVAPWKR